MLSKCVKSKSYALCVLLLISGWIHLAGVTTNNVGCVTLSTTAIIIQLSVYLLAAIGVFFDLSVCIGVLRKSWFFVLFIVFSSVSLLWATDLYVTATRLVGMLGVLAIALLLASRFSVLEFLNWMIVSCFIFCLLNYIFIYFFPDLSVLRKSVWRGFFLNENQLASTIIIFLIIGYVQVITGEIHFLCGVPVVALAIPLLIFTYSTVALFTLLSGVTIVFALLLYYKFNFSLNWCFFCLIVGPFVFYHFCDDIVGLLGEQKSFGGRIVIWNLLYDQIKMIPYLGHGYGAFAETNFKLVEYYFDNIQILIGKMTLYYEQESFVTSDINILELQYRKYMSVGAHNGYLDLLFWFGWVGLSMFMLFIVDHLRKIYILLQNKYSMNSLIFLSTYTLMFLIVNMFESLILVRSGLFWTIFVFVIFKTNETYDEFSKSVST